MVTTSVPGLLDGKKRLRYPNGATLLQSGEEQEVIDFLERNKTEVFRWNVNLSDKENYLLKTQDR